MGQEIILVKPNFFHRLAQDWQQHKNQSHKRDLPKTASARSVREQRQFWRGIIGGASVSLVVVLLGWLVYAGLTSWWKGNQPAKTPAVETNLPKSQKPQPTLTTATDYFAQAVGMAEQASKEGKSAKSSAEWLAIAAKWQKASDLMASISSKDERYETAQNRMKIYSQNSETAQQEAQRRRSQRE